LVVGDMVMIGLSALNTTLTFQPAAGVEVVFLAVSNSAATPARFDDGVNVSGQTAGGGTNLVKFGVTNALFVSIDPVAGGFTGGSGMQTQ